MSDSTAEIRRGPGRPRNRPASKPGDSAATIIDGDGGSSPAAMIVDGDGTARPAATIVTRAVDTRAVSTRMIPVELYARMAEDSLVKASDDALVTIVTNVVIGKGVTPIAAVVPIEVYDGWRFTHIEC